MQELWIGHNTWVMVGDGRKALMLRNDGTPQKPSLQVVEVLKDDDNPPTHEQGTDRPGRSFQSMSNRRSAVGQTDWHEMAEEQFATSVASKLDSAATSNRFEKLILVAPPNTLATLRKKLDPKTAERIVAEVDKDLTKHPVPEIARVLTGG
ncbi:MAG TPA: host attachment family protein [Xanthobacteraceae bacterium]|nr:host attachment family protein [Xanthobacteraceae bacterium]